MKGAGLGKEEPALILILAIGAGSVYSPVSVSWLLMLPQRMLVTGAGSVCPLVSWICLSSRLLNLSVLSVSWPH